jgi:two-component system, NarL family, invasion response regulator UvrY
MIKILIADDHPVVREGIRQIVAADANIEVVGQAVDGADLLKRIGGSPVDVVLLDLTMPGLDGLDVLKQLRRAQPKIAVLVLTMHSEAQFAVRALKSGAAGFVTKDSAAQDLVDAIKKVASGGRYISPQVAERLAEHLGPDTGRPLHDQLSDREYQVLRLIAAGRSTREISEQLSLSMKTISTYRGRLFEKMKMRNTAELTAYVINNGLAE